jgi:trans-2,3-dihydro-3-hydroxyanthranilate isomerase
MPPRILPYSIVDVFAEKAFEGNPLAVFHDARSLSTDEMQALARETNLSETTFILPSEKDNKGVRVRIFTTQEEVPFAGHPTLGTASWLYWNHATLRGASAITLSLNRGPITVRFTPPAPGEPGVRGTMQQADPMFGATHDRNAVAAAIGLSADDLDPDHAPQTVSTGMSFCIVPLRSLQVCSRLLITQRNAQRYLDRTDAKFFYCIAPAETHDNPQGPHWHARMQFYGTAEDPATGSASGCCISWLVRHGLAESETPTVIEQGIEIHRPSRITTQARLMDESISEVRVGGRTIPVATGSFFLP